MTATAVIGEAEILIKPETKGFPGQLKSDVEAPGMATAKKLAAAFAGIFAVKKGIDFLKDSVADGREAVKQEALVTAAIKSTGGAAGVTAKQIQDMAAKTAAKTGIDKEQIMATDAMLLRFTNIKDTGGPMGDVFTRAASQVQDLAVAMGKDSTGAAVQLGKALNDPVKGISALSRVGIQFTADQKAMIKTMVEAGNTTGAQNLILDQLKVKFGGAAEAIATNSMKMKVQWKEIKEQLGLALIPTIEKLEGHFLDLLPKAVGVVTGVFESLGFIWDNLKQTAQAVADRMKPLADALGLGSGAFHGVGKAILDFVMNGLNSLLIALDHASGPITTFAGHVSDIGVKLVDVFNTMKNNQGVVLAFESALAGVATAFVALHAASAAQSAIAGVNAGLAAFAKLGSLGTAGVIIAAVVALGTAAYLAYQRFEGFRNVVDAVGRWLRDVLLPILETVGQAIVSGLGAAFRWIADTAVPALVSAFHAIEPVLAAVFGVFQTIGSAIATAFAAVPGIVGSVIGFFDSLGSSAGSMWTAILGFFQPFIDWINNNITPTVVAFAGLMEAIWARISDVIGQAVAFIMPLVQGAWDLILNATQLVWTAISTAVSVAWDLIKAVIGAAMLVIGPIITGGLAIIQGAWQAGWGIIQGTFTAVWGAVTAILQGTWEVLKGIVEAGLAVLRGVFDFFAGLFTLNWGKMWSGIQEVFGGVWHGISTAFQAAVDTITGIVHGALQGTANAISGIWDGIKTTASGLIDAIVGFFKGLPGKILDVVTDLYNAGKRLAQGILNGLGDVLSGVGDVIIFPFKAAWNGLASLWNSTIGKIGFEIPNWVPFGMGGKKFEMPDLPKLAAGGIVAPQPGGVIARIAEKQRAEAVLPLPPGVLEGLTAIGQGGMGTGGTTIDARVMIGGSVYGVADLDAYMEARDRQLVALLQARGGVRMAS